MTSIYVLIDPRDGEIRYVGKTKSPLGKRLYKHLYDKDHNYRTSWIKNLKTQGLKPLVRLIQQVPHEVWQVAERYWIRYFREVGCPLTNLTDGGEGAPGISPSKVTRDKLSRANKGRKISAETRAKMSASKKGRVSYHPSAITRAKLSKALSGRTKSAETRAKVAAAQRGRVHSDEARRRMSDGCKGRVVSRQQREKISASLKGRAKSEEHRARIAAANRKRAQEHRTRKDEHLAHKK